MAALDSALIFSSSESVATIDYLLNESRSDGIGNGVFSSRT